MSLRVFALFSVESNENSTSQIVKEPRFSELKTGVKIQLLYTGSLSIVVRGPVIILIIRLSAA